MALTYLKVSTSPFEQDIASALLPFCALGVKLNELPCRFLVTQRVHACSYVQTDDLARMYRLFHRITKGLEPVAEIFKQHVEAEGNKLVKEVSEDVESKKQEGERVHMRKLVCACVRVGVGVFVVWVGS